RREFGAGRGTARGIPGGVYRCEAWPPRPGADSLQDLVLDPGLQIIQDRLRRRTDVVHVDEVLRNPPHQLFLRWSRDRDLTGRPSISSTKRRHVFHPPSFGLCRALIFAPAET